MRADIQNRYSASQALSADGDTASTDLIDHGEDRNLGLGEELVVEINVEVAPDDGNGNETYTAKLETDDNSGFSSPTQVGGTVTIPRTAALGDKFYIDLPPNTDTERFTRVVYTLGGTTASVTVSAHLIPKKNAEKFVAYASGFSV